MNKINVIVVPEKNKFAGELYNENIVYINPDLGIANLTGRNVKYLAPFWLEAKEQNVNRLFHIIDYDKEQNIIKLGNSFVLFKPWNKMGQSRKFEYHTLESFDFIEVKEGILIHYEFAK